MPLSHSPPSKSPFWLLLFFIRLLSKKSILAIFLILHCKFSRLYTKKMQQRLLGAGKTEY
ncbi:unnamed protein product [Moneuplotes crassus]|uniref:Uncharacterized protein n=1 Tax=Euplotes crassus TaxID=5936 RepID=A0AAD1Y3N3_EUPCR|nr:unnamed protein product [Moneuplotes crassus]